MHSVSSRQNPYEVQKILDSCSEDYCALKCNVCCICIHLFRCNCKDNVIGFNLCKHIHAVSTSLNYHEIAECMPNNANREANELFHLDVNVQIISKDLSPTIRAKAIKISNFQSYPKESEVEITNLFDKLISKINFNSFPSKPPSSG